MTKASGLVSNWKASQLPDLTGKCYLITGGNGGLGLEAAAYLRNVNATVLITSGSEAKGAAAAGRLTQIPSAGEVTVVELDLASTDSTRRANHLGHFLLNSLIFDLVEARSGRIVPVSSIAHRSAPGINFDDPMFSEKYSPTKAYSQSKLANLMYGLELARRLDRGESEVMSVTAHPGYSATNLQSTGPRGALKAIYRVSNRLMAQSATDGARPEVLAAAGSEAVNGAYYGPTKFGDSRGPVAKRASQRPPRTRRAQRDCGL